MNPDDPEVLAHNAQITSRNLQQEQDAPKHFPCPVCHQETSAEPDSPCASCCYSYLRRFGWNV